MNQMIDLYHVKFLIVDGNPNIRSITKSILYVLGARNIRTVANTKEALKQINVYKPDIILAEWMTEPINGIEFTLKLRASTDEKISMVPIIIVTSYSEKFRITKARDAGATEYLIQPISPILLYTRVANAIQNPRQFVRTKAFFGPDRRRHDDQGYIGIRRRQKDKAPEREVVEFDMSEDNSPPTESSVNDQTSNEDWERIKNEK